MSFVDQSPFLVAQFTRPPISINYYKSVDHAAVHIVNAERPLALVAMNCEKLVKLRRNKDFFTAPEGCVYYPDGVSMLWPVLREDVVRIPGVELWLAVLKNLAAGALVLIVGGTPAVSKSALAKLRDEYPSLRFEAVDGYQATEFYEDVTTRSTPDAVFIAMGTPKQELLMPRLQRLHRDALYMGLGGALDVFVGEVTRANRLARAIGLEWLARFTLDRHRMRRYWVIPAFAKHVLFNDFGIRVIRAKR